MFWHKIYTHRSLMGEMGKLRMNVFFLFYLNLCVKRFSPLRLLMALLYQYTYTAFGGSKCTKKFLHASFLMTAKIFPPMRVRVDFGLRDIRRFCSVHIWIGFYNQNMKYCMQFFLRWHAYTNLNVVKATVTPVLTFPQKNGVIAFKKIHDKLKQVFL